MSTWQIGEVRNEGTPVIHSGPDWLNDRSFSQSALFEETMEQKNFSGKPFSLYFEPTNAFSAGEYEFSQLACNARGSQTLLLSEQSSAVRRRWHISTKPSVPETDTAQEDLAAKQNAIRVTLLARKYVAKDQFSAEERARLAIATERVRQLMPAVTSAEFETLTTVLGKLKELQTSGNDLRDALSRLHDQE